MCKADCKCHKAGERLSIQLKASEVKHKQYDGRAFIIVPVIMARGDVVMNGTLLPVEEFFAEAWNGVPITVGHPDDEGAFISANAPDVMIAWTIGRIFNTDTSDGTSLKAEAWVDVEKANDLAPGLIASLLAGENLDVSTGFFSDLEATTGSLSGRTYEHIHRHVRPDHLAFLPNETGACSWADGCGVRANKGTTMSKKLKDLLDAFAGQAAALKAYVTDPKDEKPEEEDDEDEKFKRNQEHDEVKPEQIASMVKDALGTAIKDALPTMVKDAVSAALATNAMSADDKAAIEHAKKIASDHKAGLVTKVVANSKMSKEAAEKLDAASLQLFIDSLPAQPVATYAGRAMPETAGDDAIAKGMEPVQLSSFLKKKEAA